MARRLAIELFLVAALGFALGLVGPFGTWDSPLAVRIASWIIMALSGYALFRPLIIVGGWLSDTLSVPRFGGVAIALFLAAAPMTLLVAWLLMEKTPGEALRWDGLPMLYAQVWLIGFVINGVLALTFRQSGTPIVEPDMLPLVPPPPAPEANFTPPSSFADRLPPAFGPVLALKGEDHYVRAIGAKQSVLVLIRLRDAIAELNAPGERVHRSWWVARAGTSSITRRGREAVIQLSDGTQVPVSREAMPRLRAAGWL